MTEKIDPASLLQIGHAVTVEPGDTLVVACEAMDQDDLDEYSARLRDRLGSVNVLVLGGALGLAVVKPVRSPTPPPVGHPSWCHPDSTAKCETHQP